MAFSFQGSDIKCITEEHYGYYHGKPCLLLKLNRIYGWRPQPYYNLTEVANTDMPQDLKDHIVQVTTLLSYHKDRFNNSVFLS
jgi:hypothetical protein